MSFSVAYQTWWTVQQFSHVVANMQVHGAAEEVTEKQIFFQWVTLGAEKPFGKTSQVFHWVPSSSAEIKLLAAFRQAHEDRSNIVDCNQEGSSSPGQGSFWSWEIWIRGSMAVLNSVLGRCLFRKRANPNLSFLCAISLVQILWAWTFLAQSVAAS